MANKKRRGSATRYEGPWWKQRWIWVTVFLAVLLALPVVSGISGYINRSTVQQAEDNPLECSVYQLIDSSVNDDLFSTNEYYMRTVQVTGTFDHTTDMMGIQGICVVDPEGGYQGIYVACYFRDAESIARFSQLEPGQEVTVKGECYGMSTDVILDHCKFVSGE